MRARTRRNSESSRTSCDKVLGHPTGRILQGREGYEVDVHRLIDAMAEHIEEGRFKSIELNASPYRLDIDYRLCKYAKLMGVPVAISPDAHSFVVLLTFSTVS